jgi:cyclic pyranopterin phosphate synthase
MTRRDALHHVRAGIEAADRAGLRPIKINCVVVGGTNDDEAVAFAELARASGYHVRFIEYMPLDAEGTWDASRVVASSVLRERIDAVFGLVADDEHGPASNYRFADGAPGSVGFISSVSEPFCASCDRARITADGQFRTCLFALDETDLRGLLRSDATDGDIAAVLTDAVSRKWAGHRIGRDDFVRPARSMSQIGG